MLWRCLKYAWNSSSFCIICADLIALGTLLVYLGAYLAVVVGLMGIGFILTIRGLYLSVTVSVTKVETETEKEPPLAPYRTPALVLGAMMDSETFTEDEEVFVDTFKKRLSEILTKLTWRRRWVGAHCLYSTGSRVPWGIVFRFIRGDASIYRKRTWFGMWKQVVDLGVLAVGDLCAHIDTQIDQAEAAKRQAKLIAEKAVVVKRTAKLMRDVERLAASQHKMTHKKR